MKYSFRRNTNNATMHNGTQHRKRKSGFIIVQLSLIVYLQMYQNSHNFLDKELHYCILNTSGICYLVCQRGFFNWGEHQQSIGIPDIKTIRKFGRLQDVYIILDPILSAYILERIYSVFLLLLYNVLCHFSETSHF